MAVYFIRAGENGPVKIGRARDPERRMRALAGGAAAPLRILRTIPGGVAEERTLHRLYKAQRLHGEWFTWSDDMLTVAVEVEPAKSTPLHRAVELLGGQTATARIVGRKQSSVSMWLHRNKTPFECCILIERATGGRVTCEELRPDLADMLTAYRSLPGAAVPAALREAA